jgi:hypothetical protein
MTATELEALYAHLDRVRMTEADRQMAKANLARGEALADFLHRAVAGLTRIIRARSARAPRSPDLQAQGPNSRA